MAATHALLKPALARIRERFAHRPDTEHVQALIRIVFGMCVSAYLYATIGPRLDVHIVCIGFEVIAFCILGAIAAHPQRSVWRQYFGATVDLGTATYLMWSNGEIGAPLYGIYLWVTFGNGFRYGVRSLNVSHAMSLLGFGFVVTFSEYWREHMLLAGGFLVLLAALPSYGAILLKAIENANRTLRDQAMRDVLTGLHNRRHLTESFERELRRARRGNYAIGVMVIDIDHFKRFNDTFGHAAGDEVLRSVAQRMLDLVRREDILCRYGGEEFVLVQTKVTADALMQRAEKVRKAIGSHQMTHRGRHLGPVTLSIGAAIYPQHGNSVRAILDAADVALYRAKNLGRDRVVMASGSAQPAMDDDPHASDAPAAQPGAG